MPWSTIPPVAKQLSSDSQSLIYHKEKRLLPRDWPGRTSLKRFCWSVLPLVPDVLMFFETYFVQENDCRTCSRNVGLEFIVSFMMDGWAPSDFTQWPCAFTSSSTAMLVLRACNEKVKWIVTKQIEPLEHVVSSLTPRHHDLFPSPREYT